MTLMNEQFYYVTFWHSKLKNKDIHKISHSSIWSKTHKEDFSMTVKQLQAPQ